MNGTARVGVHRALALDHAPCEPLERPPEHVLHRAEVVVDETMVDAGLLCEAPCRDAGMPDLDEQPLGSVQQGALVGLASGELDVRHLYLVI